MFAEMFKVETDHQVAWTKWCQQNAKGYWRVSFSDKVDRYYFVCKQSAEGLQQYIQEWNNRLEDALEE